MVVDESSPLLPDHGTSSKHGPAGKHESQSSPSRVVGIAVALLGVFLANADDSFVTATYQTIASRYQLLSDAPWLLTAYNLGYCVALPIYASFSDNMGGRKNPLLTAYLLFSLGCLSSGVGVAFWQVVVGRVIAGVGGAGMVAMISVIITDIVPLNKVAALRSYVNVVGVAGRGFGGPVGGYLADTVGWRWSFFGQAPIALLCCLLAGWKLPSDSARVKNLQSDHTNLKGSSGVRNLDFVGTALFAAATTNFLLVLNLGGQRLPWSHPIVVVLAVSCALLGVGFILTEGFVAKRPLIPLRLLRTEGVGIFCLAQILLFVSKSAVISNMAPFFIRAEGATNTTAANYLLLPSAGFAIGALLCSQIIGRTYRYKALAVVSVVLSAIAFFLIALRWRYGTNFWELSYIFLAGLGIGMLLSAQFVGLSASAPKLQLATAIGMYYLSQQLGEILGTSITAAVVQLDFRSSLGRDLGDEPDMKRMINGILHDTEFIKTLPKSVQEIVRSSYLHSFQYAPIISTASCVVVLFLILYLREHPLK